MHRIVLDICTMIIKIFFLFDVLAPQQVHLLYFRPSEGVDEMQCKMQLILPCCLSFLSIVCPVVPFDYNT